MTRRMPEILACTALAGLEPSDRGRAFANLVLACAVLAIMVMVLSFSIFSVDKSWTGRALTGLLTPFVFPGLLFLVGATIAGKQAERVEKASRGLEGPARVIDAGRLEVAGVRVGLHGIRAPCPKETCLNGDGLEWACGMVAAQEATPRAPSPLADRLERGVRQEHRAMRLR